MSAKSGLTDHLDAETTACRLLICGQIVGFSGQGNKILRCTWRIQTDWTARAQDGMAKGTTQVAQPAHAQLNDFCCWAHPVELELERQNDTEQGWPKLVLEVDEIQHAFGCSGGGRATTLAYAVAPLPCSQGMHRVDVPCMRVYDRRAPRDISALTAWFGETRQMIGLSLTG
eukprot:jgi/Ulvmu1/9246/UM005_0346.1